MDPDKKKYTMAVSFQNGRYVEIEIPSVGFAEFQQETKEKLIGDEIVLMENFIFRMKDVSFIAFLEKPVTSDEPTEDTKKSQQEILPEPHQ